MWTPVSVLKFLDAAPVAEIRSDLIHPFVLLCLTLDQSPCVPVTSTLVFGDNVLITLLFVDGPDLRLTLPMVLRVVDEPGAPVADRKSDLI